MAMQGRKHLLPDLRAGALGFGGTRHSFVGSARLPGPTPTPAPGLCGLRGSVSVTSAQTGCRAEQGLCGIARFPPLDF